ncbi:TIGR03943 family putative permease subunit [Nocardia amikacinitolerans]|uniref:TIGR03943 family putative permease subunit n=1 Tax=Nocardia amikacinitolerans TaxID=756689 RepID=UPI0020A2F28B|nr:TIGR03943 family protein [Nocardia amikacinitolerans]MCP2287604.1 putative membrane protein [Nocardia amikacinitolerans]
MRRETQNLLLLLIGIAVLRTTFDGTYLRYVKPGLFPFLLISGVGIVALGTAAIIGDLYRGHAAHEHGHGRVQWLLLAPVATLLLVAPPALGAGAAVTSSAIRPPDPVVAQPELIAYPPLPDEPAPFVAISEVVNRATLDSTRSLDGREITVSGFVLRRMRGYGIDLARVVITCCVADARYIRLHLSGIEEPLDEDTWLEVRGVVEPDSARRDRDSTPTLVVREYHRVERPDHSYERGR